MSVATAVSGEGRAGLLCDVCGAATWLPFASAENVRVVDVDAAAAREAPLQLAATSSSTLAPMVSMSFSDEQRGRIRERLLELGPAGATQEELSTSFQRLLGHWQDDAVHKQFLRKASMVNELAFAGQHYRAILGEIPNDPRAKTAQSELLALAMASMSHQRSLDASGSVERAWLAVAILLVTVLLCGAIVVYLPRWLSSDAESGSRPPALEEG